ncbi:MAG: lactate utilization protein [Syntrophales bacterium LBB04]|nr:lactate utilization protein [Syntrophales bacterium LBB04]
MEQEMRNWQRERWAEQAIKNLRKNYFAAAYVAGAQEALAQVMAMLPPEAVLGLGDSLTLKEIGVLRALEERGGNLLNPWRPGIGREESMALRRRAFTADVFLTGTNALTLDGKLVNIDGLGNRVAAMIFGPKKVIVVAGINKVVKDVEEALWRIKNIAAPVNARKHDFPAELRPPCSDGGFCRDCAPPRRICCNTVIIENCARDKERITVLIVGEELGY